MKVSPSTSEMLMEAAIAQARLAASLGEVPVGAVIAQGSQIVSQAHNQIETLNDSTAHAEILAIKGASASLGRWRLTDCLLCVTLEPCTMCIGAIKLARIPLIIYGADDPRLGACGSLYDLTADERPGPVPRVITGISATTCSDLLSTFFASRRS